MVSGIDDAKPLDVPGSGGNILIARAAAAGAGLIGGLALLGWLTDTPSLKSLFPGLVSMKANTAMGLALSAAALGSLAVEEPVPAWRSRLSKALAFPAGLLGLLTLAEYAFGVGLGMDNLFFSEPEGAALTTHPGRMAAATAVEFLVLGTALLLPEHPRGRAWAQRLCAVALAAAGVSFCGYAFDLPLLYHVVAGATPMAVLTALGFVLLASGALALRFQAPSMAQITRKAVFAVFAAALAVMTFISFGAFRRMRGLIEADRRVEHSYQVIAKSRKVTWSVVEAESCCRGFAISGDSAFLAHFRSDISQLRSDLEDLGTAIRENPSQQRWLGEFSALVERKTAFMAQVVTARARQGKAEALGLIAQGTGQRLKDSIYEARERFKAEEQALLSGRQAQSRDQASRTLVSLAAGSMTSMFLVAVCLLAVLRENDLRRSNEERITRLNSILARHGRFFSLSVDMFCVAGTDGYFKEVSQAWEDALGWSQVELLARPYLDLVHPDDRPATMEKASGLGRGEAVISFENRYLCRDGSYKWLQWNSLLDAGTGLVYAVARDISGLKRVSAGLVEANKELEAFTYSVSHDLRAPLRAIEGFSRLLADGSRDRLDDEGLRLLAVVRSSTARMAQLIDDLLAFSRIGRKALERVEVDMAALARSVVSELAREKPSPSLEVSVGELPAAFGDRAMLRQVLANLIGNAVKYSGKKAAPVVEVGSARDGGETVYFVKDNGAGFDMRYAGKLFGVFQRLHHSDEFEGTGVGLALADRIVRRHGGRIWAEGRVGEGAVFRFTLPDRKGDDHERS